MAKMIELKVTSAFMWGGKLRVRDSDITLPERDARRLLSLGKAEIATGGRDDVDADSDQKPAPKRKPAPKPAKADDGDEAKNPAGGDGAGDGGDA
jgi:hypothetical protein